MCVCVCVLCVRACVCLANIGAICSTCSARLNDKMAVCERDAATLFDGHMVAWAISHTDTRSLVCVHVCVSVCASVRYMCVCVCAY